MAGRMSSSLGAVLARKTLILTSALLHGRPCVSNFARRRTTMSTLAPQLPRLPVPPLKATAASLVDSVRPLVGRIDGSVVTPASFAQFEELTRDFVCPGGYGETLQRRLLDLDAASPRSWLEDLWLANAYLVWRVPIMVNVNWWCCFSSNPSYVNAFGPGANVDSSSIIKTPQSNVQLCRASRLLSLMGNAALEIRRQSLPVDTAGVTPLCMHQWQLIFGGHRAPRRDMDAFVEPDQAEPLCGHVVVLSKGRVFKMQLLSPEGTRCKSQAQILRALTAIQELAATTPASRVPLLTGADRNDWADARQKLLDHSEKNREAFKTINSALFVLCLDQTDPEERLAFAHQIFHNTAANRWFDKTLQLVVMPSGLAGANGEHTPIDAAVPGALLMRVLEAERQQEAGARIEDEKFEDCDAVQISPVFWDVPASVDKIIEKAKTDIDALTSNIEIALCHSGADLEGEIATIGSKWIKTHAPCSPDTFFQLAMQLAYYRSTGTVTATYETATTRRFAFGRTECIRVCTTESRAFVEAMAAQEAEKIELCALFKNAAEKHADMVRQASSGLGCDRHLLGLRAMRREGDPAHAFFQHPALSLSSNFKLSTSNMSPGTHLYGGFAPVVEDGYGVNYALSKEAFLFSVSSWKSCKSTCANTFKAEIVRALKDIVALFNDQACS